LSSAACSQNLAGKLSRKQNFFGLILKKNFVKPHKISNQSDNR
jgi:hypothetical protein